MEHTVTVTAIRDHLYRLIPRAKTPRSRVYPELGRAFHAAFGQLTGPDRDLNFVAPLADADASTAGMKRALRRHAYSRIVAPYLLKNRQLFAQAGQDVFEYWEAITSLTDWIVSLAEAGLGPGRDLEGFRRDTFRDTERSVCRTFHEPGWKGRVSVSGRLDALFWSEPRQAWCAGEIKLGQGSPEIDLCQAALYRLLLAEHQGFAAKPALSLFHFERDRHEVFLPAERLAELEGDLVTLIGEIAGVVEQKTFLEPPAQVPRVPHLHSKETARLVRDVCRVFEEQGIPIEPVGEILTGPTFLRMMASTNRLVNEKKISLAAETAWLQLKTPQRLGSTLIGGNIAIDIPRADRQFVPWKDIRAQLPAPAARSCTRFPAGVSVDGGLHFIDIADSDTPHILVGGTSGSGKSEWLRAMIASLMASNTPDGLKLVLIDPKRTAFNNLDGSPYLLRPVVHPGDTNILSVMDDLATEMEERYALITAKPRMIDLRDYADAGHEPVPPRIVVVCDEFGDIIISMGRRRGDFEARVERLASKSRAAGIHLVFATQKPSRAVVTGVIKANMPVRVSLRAAEGIESQIILDQRGAEDLLGKGDLYLRVTGGCVRLQSPHVSSEELEAIARVRSEV